MKDFAKYTFATMVGTLLFTLVVVVLCIISVASIVAGEQGGAPIKNNSILRIKLAGNIPERKYEDPLSVLGDEDESASYGLDELLEAINKARANNKVMGIYIEGGIPIAPPAKLQEIRQALLEFKECGKFIYSYADTYSQGGYYVCSVADRVMVNPLGGVDWHGMASEPVFYKDMLGKLGINVQVFKVGTYKSAVEPFTSTAMSEANREQVTSYLFSIWGQYVRDVAASRHISEKALDAYADSCMLLQPAEKLVEYDLVDRLAYLDEVKSLLKERMGLAGKDNIPFVSVSDMANTEYPDATDSGNEIAVYYAFGDIVTTEMPSFLDGYSNYIASDKVVKDLHELRNDKNVKAVVIRVNSPGGSAFASEQICHEVGLLRAEKPVVVSMGGYAASGGYYISCGASRIFAEPTTLTGSIGIFGMIPDASELLTKKIGLRFDVVKTNALSDFGSLSRPMNAEESRLLQAEIERGYDTFVSHVAQGRKMEKEAVKEIAEGRVWTGEQALEIGLVDELGNLGDAITCAASLANIDDYSTATYPIPDPWYNVLLKYRKNDYFESRLRALLGEYYTTFSLLNALKSQDRVQMRLPFEPNIY